MAVSFSDESLRSLIAESSLFQGLPQKTIDQLLKKLTPLKLLSGDTLFEEGADGKALYLIASGRLSIHVTIEDKGENKQRTVGSLSRGEVVGEMSLITGEPRSASLIAVRDTLLFRLKSEDFEALFMQNPLAMKQLMSILVTRLKATTHATVKPKKATAFTLFPLSSFQSLKPFLATFADQFSQCGLSVRILEKPEALQALNLKEVQEDCGLGPWLSQQEEKVDIIFYLARKGDGALWADYCLRQSDSLLYIGEGSTPPTQYPFKRQHALAEELVLVHPQEATLPRDSHSWCRYFSNSRCHHIRYSCQKETARLVRTLTGQAIGVVMGGGGARGFAHIGALRAFDELNIPIDMIGGTSMGSLVAAAHALGWSTSQTIEIFREFFLESGGLQEYTIPLFSLIKGRKIKNALKKLLNEVMIEDLWLPFFCVATNLTNGEKALHTQGPLLEALLSSFAIPGVLPPVLKKGQILVDGAFLDNLPILPMRQKGPGQIIALNVSPVEDASLQTTCDHLPDPGPAFLRKINPFSDQESPPGIVSLLMRATTIGSVHQLESLRKEVDLFIEPPISHFGLMDWEKIDQIIEVGYQETLQKLQNWGEK